MARRLRRVGAMAPLRLVNRSDEGWMLWVMARVAHGDVLYRDVYDVTTPLPAWLGAAAVRVAGSELLVLRLLVAAVIATQVLTACSIARRAGMLTRGRVVLAVGLVACVSPLLVFSSLYTASAVLAALVTLRSVQWFLDRAGAAQGTTGPLVSIGAATAACFWSKPNIGLLALGAVVVTLAVAVGRTWRTGARAIGVVVGVFAALSVALSAVLAATGAWSAFVDQVFRSKGQYLDLGFSFATAVERRSEALTAVDPIDGRAILWLLVLATPVVVAVALAWACWRSRRAVDARLVGFVTFGVVGILSAVPRPGVDHLGSALPLMVTAAAGAVLSIPEPGPTLRARRGYLVAGAAVTAVAALVVIGTALDTSMDGITTDAPHFAATPVRRDLVHQAVRLRAGLRAHTDGKVFFLREDAGFLSLLTGTRNPLPYDIAERSDFGADGQRGVIRRLAAGEARWVCLPPTRMQLPQTNPLVPRAVDRWVRAHGTLTDTLPMCDLYELPARH